MAAKIVSTSSSSSSSFRFTLIFFLMVSLFALHQCRENPNYVMNKNNVSGDYEYDHHHEKAAVVDQVQVLEEEMSTGVKDSSNSTSSSDMKLVICLPSDDCFEMPDCWCCRTGIVFCAGNKDDCMANCG